jgi:hypothetical protein
MKHVYYGQLSVKTRRHSIPQPPVDMNKGKRGLHVSVIYVGNWREILKTESI